MVDYVSIFRRSFHDICSQNVTRCSVRSLLSQKLQMSKEFGNLWGRKLNRNYSNDSTSDHEKKETQMSLKNSASGKVIELVVTSLRVDRVAASGLGVARRKIDHSLLAGHVFLNGKRVTKKSRQITDGDVIDRISENQPNKKEVKYGQVKVLSIGELTKKGNYHIEVLRYKSLSLMVQEFWNSHK